MTNPFDRNDIRIRRAGDKSFQEIVDCFAYRNMSADIFMRIVDSYGIKPVDMAFFCKVCRIELDEGQVLERLKKREEEMSTIQAL